MTRSYWRLTKKKDYDAVLKRGRFSFNSIIGVKCLPNTLGINRFGIVISKKNIKLAVERNKIKRQIREIIKKNNYKLFYSFDAVIIVSPKIKNKKFHEIEESLSKNFKNLSNIK